MAKLSATEIAERDAAITIALVTGRTWDQIAKELGVGKQTIQAVNDRLKKIGYDSAGVVEKRERFWESVENMAIKYMDMLAAQAVRLSDPDHLDRKPTADVIAHSEFVGRQFREVIRLQRAMSSESNSSALPEPTTVHAEIVDG